MFFIERKISTWGITFQKKGVEVDLDKIRGIMDWPTPKKVTDILSFMGIFKYHRRFFELHLSRDAYRVHLLVYYR